MSIKIFDMSCTHGHRFEAWFSSLEDCDGQLARGLVVCPYCETSDVKRMPTAAHIGADVSASEDVDRTVSAQESVVREAAERFFAGVRKAAESAVDVGEDFPRQARTMYRSASSKACAQERKPGSSSKKGSAWCRCRSLPGRF